MTPLSVNECLSFAWRTFRSRPWIFFQAGLLLFLINIAVNVVGGVIEGAADSLGFVEYFALTLAGLVFSIAVSFLFSMGEAAFFLRAEREVLAVRIKDLWHPRPFWKFVGVSLLSGIIILIGLLFLIIPGIIAAIVLMFAGYLVIDKNLGPIEAIKRSVKLTEGNRWKLFQLGLLTLALNLLGLLALVIGLFVTIPLTFLMVVHAYRALAGETSLDTEDDASFTTTVPA